MTHMKPMAEHEGTFRAASEKKYDCPKCKQTTVTCRVWDSSCGGYEDYKYECQNPDCKHSWWVDGPDA